ncbi:hypothetical protein GCM10011507_19030 [Edaphobacter acidisoli]|uniref:Uncharacterized protein n=1 Tax=Edaphobacter acidisoli TaxID=2040573 RepID=A0A916RS74_9BACT|nr:hypothetical protein [Edaphobacter acidisoli]GGA67679.1 hypothetical protein GCM10011507_19030 [Edaphobacter acidisoli]
MQAQLRESDFTKYPPEARKLALQHFDLIEQLPVAFAIVFLRQLIDYDWRFPAERAEVDDQLSYLGAMSSDKLQSAMAGFASLSAASSLANEHWWADPIASTEKLTAQLWAQHQMDHFGNVAQQYQHDFRAAVPESEPAIPRLCIAIVGKDAAPGTKLFEKLRPYGTYFTQVNPTDGVNTLLAALNTRAQASPAPYAHWYIEGGSAQPVPNKQIATVSYDALTPVREALLEKMTTVRLSGAVGGPENLRSVLAELRPDQIRAAGAQGDEVLQHFQLSLLTEGSGTQIFSTTFVQWAAREALRRARPLTLVTRYSPRQTQRPMNEMWMASRGPLKVDPQGSLIDADMGAYYTWINQRRLTGAGSSRFIAWFEDQHEAIVVAPAMAKGTVSTSPCDLPKILSWIA